jgi:phenol 2-monooxygenase (NADPH)
VPGPNGNLIRQGPFCSSKVNESPFHNMLLSQGRLERFILDSIQQHSDLEIERGIIAESLEYDETLEDDPNAYPITVQLRTLSEEETNSPSGLDRSNLLPDDWDDLIQKSRKRQTKVETVKAKYLIGCDGAHSWTRKQVNIPLEGSSTDHIWSVYKTLDLDRS